jgi:protein TonB
MSVQAAAVPNSNLLTFGTLDRTAGRRMSPQSIAIAALLNVAALLLLVVQVHHAVVARHAVEMVTLDAPVLPPAPPKLQSMGGGGGQPDKAPVAKGNPPKFAREMLNPPKAPPLEQPKIAIAPAIDVDPSLKMAKTDLPNFGMPNSPLVGTSMGNGHGNGIGSGTGGGLGAGSGGGTGGGVRRIGGGVSAPRVLFAPEPEFSEEARKAKVAGNVLVYLQVDPNGKPTHVRVLRGIGMGLDEKAVEAVSQYKFKPAMEDGKPVTVEMQVEVNFQIF